MGCVGYRERSRTSSHRLLPYTHACLHPDLTSTVSRHPKSINQHRHNAAMPPSSTQRPQGGGRFVLLVLSLVTGYTLAFHSHHPPPPAAAGPRRLQGQHSQPPPARALAGRGRPLVVFAAAAGDEEGQPEEQQSSSAGGGGIKPRAFVTKRMRRGPLGPSGSSSSSKSSSGSKAQQPSPPPTAAGGKGQTDGPGVLKLSKQWACVAGCGACCYLQPEERPYLMDYFEDPEDLAAYNSMVGDDGWCVHYDKAARACTIFSDRPWFCRVESETFKRMYDVDTHEMDKFCTGCCREQIGDVYGVGSPEMLKFNTAIKALKAAAKAEGGNKGAGKGFGGGGGVKKGAGAGVVPVDPFTQEPVGEDRVKADWV